MEEKQNNHGKFIVTVLLGTPIGRLMDSDGDCILKRGKQALYNDDD